MPVRLTSTILRVQISLGICPALPLLDDRPSVAGPTTSFGRRHRALGRSDAEGGFLAWNACVEPPSPSTRPPHRATTEPSIAVHAPECPKRQRLADAEDLFEFGGDRNEVTLIAADGMERWPSLSKAEVAAKLVARLARKLSEAPA